MKLSFSKLSKREIRYIFSLLYLIVLIPVTLNALNILLYRAISNDQCAWRDIPGRYDAMVITDIVPGGVADEAGIKGGDILLKIDSENFDIRSPEKNPMVFVNKIPSGGYATYTIERNGTVFDVKIRMLNVFQIPFLATLLLGLGFFIVGYIVVMCHPEGFIQRLFGFYSLLTMTFFSFLNVNLTDFDWLNIPVTVLVSAARLLGTPLQRSEVRIITLGQSQEEYIAIPMSAESLPISNSTYVVSATIPSYLMHGNQQSHTGFMLLMRLKMK